MIGCIGVLGTPVVASKCRQYSHVHYLSICLFPSSPPTIAAVANHINPVLTLAYWQHW